MAGHLGLALQVGAAVVLFVLPALLFLGLLRGLKRIQHDELVEQMRSEVSEGAQPPFVPGALAEAAPMTSSGNRVRCPACDTPNVPDATFCQQCLRQLPGE